MSRLLRNAAIALLCILPATVRAAYDLGFGGDDDLFHFVTRPELKPPKFNVTKHYPDEITPGYWFVAPYANIVQEPFANLYYQACQTGPTIYDQDGQLVWSGACQFHNRNACDFRVFEANGSEYMSLILTANRQYDTKGLGVIVNSSLQVLSHHRLPDHLQPFNMHEFKVIENGRKALHIAQRTEVSDISDVKDTNLKAGFAVNQAIHETDLWTGALDFQYWLHDDLDWSESNVHTSKLTGPFPDAWDWLHLNAVDKNDEGDYLVTARYTDAIYKVSGKEKRILWRLGGQKSDFKLDGFRFAGPHDARFMSSDNGKEYISFLDNGGDEERKTAEHSTAYYLELDKTVTPWKASVVHAWKRSDKRGNVQILPNGNAFVGWSENSYISEHTRDGRVLYEAHFAAKRFVTYRAYLYNITITPNTAPVVKGFAYGSDPDSSVSVYYVSWNGATEVVAWRFLDAAKQTLLGAQTKTSFETSFHYSGPFVQFVTVEAVLKDGSVRQWSADAIAAVVEVPEHWKVKKGEEVLAGKTVDDSTEQTTAAAVGVQVDELAVEVSPRDEL